jgi:hypothetical protein
MGHSQAYKGLYRHHDIRHPAIRQWWKILARFDRKGRCTTSSGPKTFDHKSWHTQLLKVLVWILPDVLEKVM